MAAACFSVCADGSKTWQRQDRHSAFFALHDLTHFAVESVLGYRSGFFGLVESGWDISETDGKSQRGPLPLEALEVESIVGLLDRERASGAVWSAADFETGRQAGARPLSDEDLERVRQTRDQLFARWVEVEPGSALELEFSQVK
jgi:hypothetical protein